MKESFGTAPHMLRRNEDPKTSHAAADSVDTTKLEKAVHSVIEDTGYVGAISDEIRDAMSQTSDNSITPRFASLLRKGFIYRKGDTRTAESGRQQLVLRANRRINTKRYWGNERRAAEEKAEPPGITIKRLQDEIVELKHRLAGLEK